ncbi:dehydrogenase [Teratosphaeria nubilosa]|uniref:Dehydrogenase n=1 Tax=Teratosphaeria nubilosa TaxID=161662 RepID=A0A6G1KX34_9PEZI|nr:dehydrogenase [Teratosphaeria nubilosa]
MSEKIILITGANQGLGYFAAKHFAASSKYHVLLASRDHTKGQQAVDKLVSEGASKHVLEAVQLDVTSDDSIAQAIKTIEQQHGRLDILVHNAGISVAGPNASLREEYQTVYNTNVFGPEALTEAALPLLRKSTLPGGRRIIFVSSSLGTIEFAADAKHPYNGKLYKIYRSSKTALNMVMACVGSTLEDEGFVVGAMCPGYCGTNLNGYAGPKDPSEGAKVIVLAVEADKERVHKKVIHVEGAYPW